MKPEKLTIEDLEKEYESPAEKWHGECSQLAHIAIAVLGHGDYAYGHYLGHVDPDGYWGKMAFQRHGWVLLDDGRVLDPTRWSFENVEPYIYIGNAKDYDEGGNAMREAMSTPCPPANEDPANISAPDFVRPLFEHLTKTPFETLTRRQIVWVANLSYNQLDFAVADIYQTLIDNKMSAYIPIDNLNRAKREGRINA